jgi:hypothetical protein
VNDNLDLGCTIIERAATDKAVRDIDKSLAQVRGGMMYKNKLRRILEPQVKATAYHNAKLHVCWSLRAQQSYVWAGYSKQGNHRTHCHALCYLSCTLHLVLAVNTASISARHFIDSCTSSNSSAGL